MYMTLIRSFKSGGTVCQNISAFFLLLIVRSITVKYQNISPDISFDITFLSATAFYASPHPQPWDFQNVLAQVGLKIEAKEFFPVDVNAAM